MTKKSIGILNEALKDRYMNVLLECLTFLIICIVLYIGSFSILEAFGLEKTVIWLTFGMFIFTLAGVGFYKYTYNVIHKRQKMLDFLAE